MIRVLIIDDEPLVRMGMKSIIAWEEHGYRIVGEAGNGVQGLEKIFECRPDLVLIDIMMPQMDGLTVIAEARKGGFAGKFIILSCVSEIEYLQKAIRLGVSSYVLKNSVNPQEILEMVEEAAQGIKKGKILPEDFTENFQENTDHFAFREFMNLVFKGVITKPQELREKMKVFGYDQKKNAYLIVSSLRDAGKDYRTFLYRMAPVGGSMLEEYWGVCLVNFEDYLILVMSSVSRKEAEEVAFRLKASAKQYFDLKMLTAIRRIDVEQWNIAEQYEDAKKELSGSFYGDELTDAMIQYIHSHCNSKISTKDVAEHVHFSVDYTCKYFKKKTQTNLTDYILKLKIYRSHKELSEGKSIAEIADIYGFSSGGHYLKVFKKYEGITPGMYVKGKRAENGE